jgi:hypothetical protein
VDFEGFRPDLARVVPRSDGSKGGRPFFDHVLMFKILILQASHSLSDKRAEYLIKDRRHQRTLPDLAFRNSAPPRVSESSPRRKREVLGGVQLAGCCALAHLQGRKTKVAPRLGR